jgi:hypothetical protein
MFHNYSANNVKFNCCLYLLLGYKFVKLIENVEMTREGARDENEELFAPLIFKFFASLE